MRRNRDASGRHPLGRRCRDVVPLALLLMPYALVRYAYDCMRGRP